MLPEKNMIEDEQGKRKTEATVGANNKRKKLMTRRNSSDVTTNCSSMVVDIVSDGAGAQPDQSLHKTSLKETKCFVFPEQLSLINKSRRSLLSVDLVLHDEVENFVTGSITLESISEKEKALIHAICQYLEPSCVVALSCVSKKVLTALSGFPLELCNLNRTFSASEISFWFGRKCMKMHHIHSHWKIASVKVMLEEYEQDEFFGLLHLETLKELVLSGTTRVFNAGRIKRCSQLKLLDTGMFCETVEGLDSFAYMTELECLYLRNAQSIQNLSFLGNMSTLTELSFYMCNNLTSIDGLKQCAALKVLDFGGCLSLDDISPLAGCFQLEQISFAECHRIPRIAPICSSRHNKLYHIDLIGCTSLEDLEHLNHLVSLRSIKAFRTNTCQLINLLSSPNKRLEAHAWDVVKTTGVFDLNELAPHIMHTLRRNSNLTAKNKKKIVKLIVLLTQHEMATSFFVDAGAPDALLDIASEQIDAHDLQGQCLKALGNLCRQGNLINDIATRRRLGQLLQLLRNFLANDAASERVTRDEKFIAQGVEFCTSILLFIAADSRARHNLLEWFPESINVINDVLRDGTHIAQAEAAGAIWNLSASLEIGQLVIKSPCLVRNLIDLLDTSQSLSCRVQAAGALRNLAIVPSNKSTLVDHGISEPLVKICKVRVNQLENQTTSDDEMCSDKENMMLLVFKAIAIIRILAIHDEIAGATCSADIVVSLFVLASREKDNRVVRQACGAILALSCHDFGRARLNSLGGVQVIVNILSNPDLMHPATVSCLGALWYLASESTRWSRQVFTQATQVLFRWVESENPEIRIRAAGALRCLSELGSNV